MDENKVRFSVYLGTLYLLLCSTIFLYSYWSALNIDIFFFIHLADLIIYAISPLTIISLCTAFAAYFYISSRRERSPTKNNNLIFLIILIAVFMGIGIWKGLPLIYIGLPLVLVIAYIAFHYYHDFPIEIIVTMLILFLGIFAQYETGKNRASKIIKNCDYRYIIETIDNVPLTLKYLGHMNDNFFFSDTDNTRIIIKTAPPQLILNNSNKNLHCSL